ncbi:MAG TPA: hypothetical protein VGZ22_04665 [Isosphaeraceae bacterium]|jgi:hypothetical protein|nr:hypothetical protein [Isosphaeraceae bacterium]
MKTPRSEDPASLTIQACKIRAALLLKDLRSADPPRAVAAAERLRALPHLAAQEPDAILGQRGSIRLEHALEVIAAELGYPSWTECRHILEPPVAGLDTEAFFTASAAYFLNRWFVTYDEALASLEAEGGFLFPYRHQFFICDSGFVSALGVDPNDPDWEQIGRDWVRPHDEPARTRLEQKLIALGYTRQATS